MAEEAKQQKNPTSKPANCMQCNKRLKRKSWYYRNGAYFCNKRCWKASQMKPSLSEALAGRAK